MKYFIYSLLFVLYVSEPWRPLTAHAVLIDDVLQTEGLMPLKNPGVARIPNSRRESLSRPILPPRMVPTTRQQVILQRPIETAPDVEDMLEAESLLLFDNKPLSRYRRDVNSDNNIEGSGGDDPSTTTAAPTVQCHALTCNGTECLDAFNKTDGDNMCTTTGSCFIKATFNESYRSVEAKCDARSQCDWQMFSLETWFEVSSCCYKDFCNELEQLKGDGVSHHVPQGQYHILISLSLALYFLFPCYHGDTL